MTTDGDPVDLASALEQLWGPRRGPAPTPAPPPRGPEPEAAPAPAPAAAPAPAPAEAAPPVVPPPPVVDAGVDTRLAELRAEIDTLRTQLLAALDEHGSRIRDDARERAARQPVEAPPVAVEPDVDVEGEVGERIDEVAAQVTGLAERFAGLERLVETAMVEGAKRETTIDRGRARLRATIDEVNARVGVLAERFAGLERLVELAVSERAERSADPDDASVRLEAAMDGFDAVVAGLDAAVAGLASAVTDRLAAVAADVVRDATLAPLRRELRGAKADLAAVRDAVAELQADVSSLRSMATPPAPRAAKPAKPAARPAPAAPAAAATKRAAAPAKKTAAPAPAKKTPPRRPVARESVVEDGPEAVERPARTPGSRRPFRGEFTTWEEDESVHEATTDRGTDAAAARDRRRQILAEAARGAAEGDLDLDGLDEIFTDTEPGRGSPEGDAGDGASKRSRFGSRRHRTS